MSAAIAALCGNLTDPAHRNASGCDLVCNIKATTHNLILVARTQAQTQTQAHKHTHTHVHICVLFMYMCVYVYAYASYLL